MKWYKSMTKQQREGFSKVLAVSVIGAIIVLLVPMVIRFI